MARGEVDQSVAMHFLCRVLVYGIETRTACDKLGSKPPWTGSIADRQAAVFSCAARQQFSGFLVDGILQRELRVHLQPAERALIAQLRALDPRAVQILHRSHRRDRIGDEHDEIGNAILEIRGAEAVRSYLVIQTDFLAARTLGPQVRIGDEERITCRVEIVESRRLERGSGPDSQPQLRGQAIPVTEQSRRMVSELTVVVFAEIRLPIVLFVRSHVSGERRPDRAMVLRERGIARNVLRQIFGARCRGARTKLDVVLPGELRLPRPEEAREGPGSRALVLAFSGSYQTLPAAGDPAGAIERKGGNRLMIHGVDRGVVVQMRAPVALEYRKP